jgi:hypothetical protein
MIQPRRRPGGGHLSWVKLSGGFADGAFWPRTIEEPNLTSAKAPEGAENLCHLGKGLAGRG